MDGRRERAAFLNAILANWFLALAFGVLRQAARRRPKYAHAWHGQVARIALAAGCSGEQAFAIARSFSLRAFGVDTCNLPRC